MAKRFSIWFGALTPSVVLACLMLLVAGLGEANAAVRRCMQPIMGDIVAAPSELIGKRLALQSWVAKTRSQHGQSFSSWRVAVRKVLGCRPGAGGSGGALQCVAFAAPCRIDQVPGAPGNKPRRAAPGAAIET